MTTKKATERNSVKKKTTKNKTFSSAVSLPSNMSQRAITKSLTYKASFAKYFEKPIQHVAYASGFSFILVGSFFTLAQYIIPLTASTMTASLPCSSGECSNENFATLSLSQANNLTIFGLSILCFGLIMLVLAIELRTDKKPS